MKEVLERLRELEKFGLEQMHNDKIPNHLYKFYEGYTNGIRDAIKVCESNVQHHTEAGKE